MTPSAFLIIIILFGLLDMNQSIQTTDEIEKMIFKMTLREKIGQLVQLSLSEFVDKETRELNETKLEHYINTYNIGSFMNNFNDGSEIPPPNPKKWLNTLNTIQSKYAKTKLKIPMIYGLDCVHGANYIHGATLFPQQLGLASSFNRNLTKLVAEITAKDTRAVGVHWNFSPVLDIAVNKQWSRVFETFGEDPYLCSELGKVMISGYQGYPRSLRNHNKVAATMKHFIGYSATYTGRDVDGNWVSDRIIEEYFLPPFEAALKQNVATTMESYNDIAGDHIINSEKYLVKLLRKKLNFTGVLVTDWGQIEKLHHPIRIAKSMKDAVRLSMRLGSIDMTMVPSSMAFIDHMVELIEEGLITEDSLNTNVRRILNLKSELGLFETHGQTNENLINNIGSQYDQNISLDAAREGVILLKNKDKILPLSKDSKLLVTGPTSNSLAFLNGGWTLNWRGVKNDSWFLNGSTIIDGIRKHNKNVFHEDSVDIEGNKLESFDKVLNIASSDNIETIVVCLGEKSYVEMEGNVRDMSLPFGQIDLIEKLSKTGKAIILIMSQGRPRSIGNASELASGIINGFLLGPHGGEAFSDVLFGNFNPCGKLPITYSNYPTGSNLNYYGRANEVYDPEWAFGFGMSYTSFSYKNLILSRKELKLNQSIEISVDVSNVGKTEGKEVVLVYITDLYRSIAPEKKKLIGFEKVQLIPNETATVKFSLDVKDISFYGVDNLKRAEGGSFNLTIGDLVQEFNFNIEGDKEFILI